MPDETIHTCPRCAMPKSSSSTNPPVPSLHQPNFKFSNNTTKDRTAILISHRLSTVRMVDTIYVLENGRIVEHEHHDNLIRRGGTYAQLFEKQARHYR
ncbi:MAG: hypothetical protein ABFS56_22765 [Pseudomonadota bacterium]